MPVAQSGCSIVGQNQSDEFAMGSSTEHSAFGTARNPWDTTRVPGDRRRSAVAVAARMVPAALGSRDGGSVRQPAAPLRRGGAEADFTGRISRTASLAFGSSVDQIGIVTKPSAECAELLGP